MDRGSSLFLVNLKPVIRSGRIFMMEVWYQWSQKQTIPITIVKSTKRATRLQTVWFPRDWARVQRSSAELTPIRRPRSRGASGRSFSRTLAVRCICLRFRRVNSASTCVRRTHRSPASRTPAHGDSYSASVFIFIQCTFGQHISKKRIQITFVLVAKPKILEIAVLFGKSRAAMRTSTSDTESTRCINMTLEGRESDISRHTISVDVLVHSVPHPTAAHLRLLFASGDGSQKSERWERMYFRGYYP